MVESLNNRTAMQGWSMNNRRRIFLKRLPRGCAALMLLIAIGANVRVQAADALKITVYGGSGRIGQRIVDEALNRGHGVTIIVRDPSSVKEQGARLSVAKGDVLDTTAVAKQIAGQDIVISAVNARDAAFFPKAAQSLVAAARSLGAKAPRILWVGGAGSLQTSPGGKTLIESGKAPPGPGKGHKDALDYFRTVTDVSWTYLSPAMRIEPGTRTGQFRLGKDELVKDEKGTSRISMEDYAVAMLDEVEKPQHIRSRFTVGY